MFDSGRSYFLGRSHIRLAPKLDRSNKFDLCYYGQVNSRQLKSSVASKATSKHL